MYTIIGKPNCPQCDKAKTMMTVAALNYEYKEIGKDITREEVMQAAPSARSVPILFLGDIHIGGIQEVKQLCGV